MGTSNVKDDCATCKRKLADCSGHWGYIELMLPVYHVGFFRTTIAVLQCICKRCSRVLLTGKPRKRHIMYMRDPRIDAVRKAKNFKAIIDVRGFCSVLARRRMPLSFAIALLRLRSIVGVVVQNRNV